MYKKINYAYDLEKQIEEKNNIKTQQKRKEIKEGLYYSNFNMFIKDENDNKNSKSKNNIYNKIIKEHQNKNNLDDVDYQKHEYGRSLREQINKDLKQKELQKKRIKEEELWYENKAKKEQELIKKRYEQEKNKENEKQRINTAYIKEQQKELEIKENLKEKSSKSSFDEITNQKKKDVFISKPLIPKGEDKIDIDINTYENQSEEDLTKLINNYESKRKSNRSYKNDIVDNLVSGYMSFKKSNYEKKKENNNIYDFKFKKEINNLENIDFKNDDIIHKINNTLNKESIKNKIYIPFNINNPTSIDSYKKFVSFVNDSKNINEELLNFQNEINQKLDIINWDSENLVKKYSDKDYKNRFNQIVNAPFISDLIQIHKNDNYKQMIPDNDNELLNYFEHSKLDLSDLNKKVFNNHNPNFEISGNGMTEKYFINKKQMNSAI